MAMGSVGKLVKEAVESNTKRYTTKTAKSNAKNIVNSLESKNTRAFQNLDYKSVINESIVTNPSSRGLNKKMSSEATFNKVFKSEESIAQQRSIERSINKKASNEESNKLLNSMRSNNTKLNDTRVANEYSNNHMKERKNRLEYLKNKHRPSDNVNKSNSQYDVRDSRNKAMSMEERTKREAAGRAKAEESRIQKVLSEEGKKNYSNKTIKEQNAEAGAKTTSDAKKKASREIFSKSNIQKGVGLGVGGALVFSMFDKGGQMSNAELYGQQQPYGY